MSDSGLDALLDTVRDDQLASAAELAAALQQKAAFAALRHELVLLAAQVGTEAARAAVPFLASALLAAL